MSDHLFPPADIPPGAIFPPRAVCVCGCQGSAHRTVWVGDEFKGTRCDAHGGHKFAVGRQEAFVEEPPAPKACPSCGFVGLIDGACAACGHGARPIVVPRSLVRRRRRP